MKKRLKIFALYLQKGVKKSDKLSAGICSSISGLQCVLLFEQEKQLDFQSDSYMPQ